jgi:molecular chaperone HscB
MKLDSDDFELFGLPRRFEQDREDLDRRWRDLQAQVHPDKFAIEGAAGQRVAMQWAMRVNEAYQRLKDPLGRAAYLCELQGAPIQAESNTAMPAGFLVQQMEWREALDEAGTLEQVELLARQVAQHRSEGLTRLGSMLDQTQDFAAAAQSVRALMFVERFAQDVEQRLEALEQ